jgi:hypothetical protein
MDVSFLFQRVPHLASVFLSEELCSSWRLGRELDGTRNARVLNWILLAGFQTRCAWSNPNPIEGERKHPLEPDQSRNAAYRIQLRAWAASFVTLTDYTVGLRLFSQGNTGKRYSRAPLAILSIAHAIRCSSLRTILAGRCWQSIFFILSRQIYGEDASLAG